MQHFEAFNHYSSTSWERLIQYGVVGISAGTLAGLLQVRMAFGFDRIWQIDPELTSLARL